MLFPWSTRESYLADLARLAPVNGRGEGPFAYSDFLGPPDEPHLDHPAGDREMVNPLPENSLHIQFGKFKAAATGRLAIAAIIIGLILLAVIVSRFW